MSPTSRLVFRYLTLTYLDHKSNDVSDNDNFNGDSVIYEFEYDNNSYSYYYTA